MNVSGNSGHDPLGLFPYASWLSGHGFILSLLLCLVVSPILMIVLAPLGESRFLPLGKNQFKSFFPGDVYLAVMAAILLSLATDLPHSGRWYNSFWWNLLVQVAALAAAILLTLGEYRAKAYPRRALKSPTKVYHNALYAIYGYVIVVTFVAVLFGSHWTFWFGVEQTVAWCFGYLWLRNVIRDGRLQKTDPEAFARKIGSAHIADWKPIWKTAPAIFRILREKDERP